MLLWIDTIIGMVVVLLATSLIVMLLTQIISTFFNLRGTNLKKGLVILLKNSNVDLDKYAEDISDRILRHELITDRWNIRHLKRDGLASSINPAELKNVLNILAESAPDEWRDKLKNSLDQLEAKIDTWFDSVMARTTQFFIMNTRVVTIFFSLIVAFSIQLNGFDLFEQISTNSETRANLVSSSEMIMDKAHETIGSTGSEDLEALLGRTDSVTERLKETQLQLIPDKYPNVDAFNPLKKDFWGVLAMAGLLSLGAPFWFNVLKSLSSLRPIIAGKADQRREEDKSE